MPRQVLPIRTLFPFMRMLKQSIFTLREPKLFLHESRFTIYKHSFIYIHNCFLSFTSSGHVPFYYAFTLGGREMRIEQRELWPGSCDQLEEHLKLLQ